MQKPLPQLDQPFPKFKGTSTVDRGSTLRVGVEASRRLLLACLRHLRNGDERPIWLQVALWSGLLTYLAAPLLGSSWTAWSHTDGRHSSS